jgi:hypothetical protein
MLLVEACNAGLLSRSPKQTFAVAAAVAAAAAPAAGIGHSLLSYSSSLRGISKLQLDADKLHQVSP